MKKSKKILSIGLAFGMLAGMALTVSAAPREDYEPAVKGNRYLISVETIDSESGAKEIKKYTVDENYKPTDALLIYEAEGQQITAGGEEYILNADGTVKEIKSYEFGSENEKDYTSSRTYEYDANGNIIKDTQTDLENDPPYVEYILQYTYDANGNKTSYTIEAYNEDGQKTSETNSTYRYDSNNNCTEVIHTNSDSSNTRDTYEYDTNGKKTLHYYDIYNAGEWKESFKEVTTYSADGLTATTDKFFWKIDEGDYDSTPQRREVETVDTNGNVILKESYVQTVGGSLIEDSKTECTYDTFGNLLTQLEYVYDEEQSAYVLGFTVIYTYGEPASQEEPTEPASQEETPQTAVQEETPQTAVQVESPKTADAAAVAIELTGVMALVGVITLGALVVFKKKA